MSRNFYWESFPFGEADVVVFGIPVGRKGKIALEKLRNASWFIESFDLDKKRDLVKDLKLADRGDLEIRNYSDLDKITDTVREIIRMGKVPLAIGGGHLTTFYKFKAFDDNTKLLVFDSHCDAKEKYIDEKIVDLSFLDGEETDSKLNDATWLNRLCETVTPRNIAVLGIRSGDSDEMEFLENKGITYFTSNQIKDNTDSVKETIRKWIGNSPVFVNVDIDVFDPSIAPAVDQPEANGLYFREFSKIVNSIDGKTAGLDLVCFSPIEGNEVTEFLAVRVIYEILGKIPRPKI